MKATWFENKELITLYTDPAYFGADVPDSYMQRPCKPVSVDSLFGYEPESKMDDIHHKNSVLKLALKMRTGQYDGPPIVCRKHPKGLQVLDGHHRMQAARRAGVDKLDAVIVDSEDIQYSDEVKEQQVNEASGYIPTAAQANDPRFKTALTVDVRPGAIQRNIKALALDANMDLVNKTKPGRKYKKPTLKEAPQDWGDMKLDGDKTQQSIDYFYTDHAPNKIGNRRDAGNFKGFDVVTFTKGADTLMFLVDNKDRAVFYVAFTDMKDGVAIGNVRSNGTVRSTEVYAFLVDKFKTLYSDKHQTPQGRKIWTDFAKFFPNIKVTDTGERLKATTLAESLMEKYQAIKEEDLVEVEASPTALRSWASSDEAQGVRAGFELELIFADTEREDDGDYDEPNFDYDQPIDSNLDRIIEFYDGENGAWDYLHGMTEDEFRERIIEDLMDYINAKTYDYMNEYAYDDIKQKLTGDDNFEELDPEAAEKYIDDEIEEQGRLWQEAFEDKEEEYRESTTWGEFFDEKNIQDMSDLMNNYGLRWPYEQSSMGGSLPIESWGEQISEVVGKPVDISYTYHGSDKKEGHYTIEPDSSLSADEDPDSGYELVSPVMPLDEALDQLDKLFDYIEEQDGDIYTNSSTGLHMNISVPQGNKIDYTKLVLFSGDKYILDQYSRFENQYAESALGQIENRAGQLEPERALQAMQKMKTNLEDAAEEFVRGSTGQSKYTSVHIKDGYIEFRGPGGQYTAKSFGEVKNTLLRFARAMTIAADPDAYKQEYQKKLYKIISKGQEKTAERTVDSLFADLQAGTINSEVFKKRWANLVVQQKQNQTILNKLDGVPDDKRIQKAKAIQQSTAGRPKPFKYNLPIEDDEGNRNGLKGKIKAASAQLAKQAAVDEILKRLKDPNLSQYKPRFSELKVEIDLEDPQNYVRYAYSIPYQDTRSPDEEKEYSNYIDVPQDLDMPTIRGRAIRHASEKFFEPNADFTISQSDQIAVKKTQLQPDFENLATPAQPQDEPELPDTAGNYRITIPYEDAGGEPKVHTVNVAAESPEEAKEQAIEIAKGTFFTSFNNVTPDFQGADVLSTDAAWMQ